MDILFCRLFESVTDEIIRPYIKSMAGSFVEKKYYTPEDLYGDERLLSMLEKDIGERKYDAVFTINFWPLVARACFKKGIKYISWSYDSPQNLPTDEDMDYETNYVFMFDKDECKSYQKRGIDRVWHMPLATDVKRWDGIKNPSGISYDITFVGKVYESVFPLLRNRLDEYNEGYLNAIIAAQRKLVGYFMIDELLDDKRMSDINRCFNKKNKDLNNVSRAQMSYSVGSYITYQDRLTLLRLLQNAGKVHLFSDTLEPHTKEILKGVDIHGRIDYERKMPEVFKASKINLNPTLRVIKSGIPQRALDIMGCKAFMLTSFQPEIFDYFTEGEDVACYYSYEDAYDKADYYLRNDSERERIAALGYEKIKTEFTFEKRLSKMFEIAGVDI